MKNQVQLIAYADRLGNGDLSTFRAIVNGPLRGLFGGVHILPFFSPIDGADAGFDPSDHTQVDPRMGGWGDVRALAADIDIMADLIVNHISAASPQFQDYLERGDASPHAGLFLTEQTVFPGGASEKDLAAIYRPRPGAPFTTTRLVSGEERRLWTTFTAQQIDIDVLHAQGMAYIDSILRQFCDAGIRMVRLDAVGYAIKRAGSKCFMLPETYDFIAQLSDRIHALGMEALVEIHSYYRDQMSIARHADRVYDFALPPLLLHAFAFGTSSPLAEWVKVRPTNAITVLDTHDGIGIVDVGADASDPAAQPGLVPADELAELVEIIHRRTDGASRRATGASASNIDIYQVNSTIFDAMGGDEVQYLLARCIQFMVPGVPQVYYVGLLAGGNDVDLLARTGVGRDINRAFYGETDLHEALDRPVVRQLLDLIALRNDHPAFGGTFGMTTPSPRAIVLRWDADQDWIELAVDFAAVTGTLRFSDAGHENRVTFGDPSDEHPSAEVQPEGAAGLSG